MSEPHQVSEPSCDKVKCRTCHLRSRGCKGLGQPCPEKDQFGYRIKSPADWWALAEEKNVSLRGLLFKYVDPETLAEHMNGIKLWYPHKTAAAWMSETFDQALKNHEFPVLRRMLGVIWMAAPNVIPDGGYGKDWDALCDLCSEDGVFNEMIEGEG